MNSVTTTALSPNSLACYAQPQHPTAPGVMREQQPKPNRRSVVMRVNDSQYSVSADRDAEVKAIVIRSPRKAPALQGSPKVDQTQQDTALSNEMEKIYRLRKNLRKAADRNQSDPYEHIIDGMLLSTALMGLHDKTQSLACLNDLLTQHEHLAADDIAARAYKQKEINRSSALFAYLRLRRLGPEAQASYLDYIHHALATSVVIQSDIGEKFVQWQNYYASELFLCKVAEILPKRSPEYLAQIIFVRHLGCGNLAQAEIEARHLLQEHPHNPFILGVLGVSVARQTRFAEAAIFLREATSCWRARYLPFPVFNALGDSELALDQPLAAYRSYRQSIEIAPYDFEGFSGLGQAYFLQKDYPKAEEWQQRVIALVPFLGEPYVKLARTQVALLRYREALATYQKAELWPCITSTLQLITEQKLLAELCEDYQLAIHLQRRITSRWPTYSAHWNDLGLLLSRTEDWTAAHAAFEQGKRVAWSEQHTLSTAALDPAVPGLIKEHDQIAGLKGVASPQAPSLCLQ